MTTTGFTVIYRWELAPDREDAFIAAWRTVTRKIRDHHGGLGSRLHRADDGTWVAYAQWPDRESWQKLQGAPPVDENASATMGAAVVKRHDPILMEPVADLLAGAG